MPLIINKPNGSESYPYELGLRIPNRELDGIHDNLI